MPITLLHALFVALHLVAAGLAAVGPLLAAGLRLALPAGASRADESLKRLVWWSAGGLLATALLGLVIGLAQYRAGEAYRSMLTRFPGELYLFTALEWGFSLVCTGVLLALWRRWRQRRWWLVLIALVSTTNLLYHLPPLMIIQSMLVERPWMAPESVIHRQLYLDLMYLPEVLVGSLHFVGAATVLAASVAVRLLVSGPRDATDLVRWSAAVGLVATLVQLFSGLGYLLLLPPAESGRLLGDSLLATSALAVSSALALVLVERWTALLIDPARSEIARRPVAIVLTIFFVMSLAAKG